jgi:hypothetical protein
MNTYNDPDRFPPIYDQNAYDTTLGFAFRRASIPQGKFNALIVSMPHWSLVFIASLLVLALKTKPRRQFTLLSIFYVMTCVAVVLGVLAGVDRASQSENQRPTEPMPQRTPAEDVY